jgi:hypothetical protein
MNKFMIEAVAQRIHVMAEPGEKAMEVAQVLSAHYGEVTVTMFARVRRRYENGKLVSSNPDLNKFYANPTPQECWEWSCLGQVKD